MARSAKNNVGASKNPKKLVITRSEFRYTCKTTFPNDINENVAI
jgi:hypothetical protein